MSYPPPPFDVVLVVSNDSKTIHCKDYQEAVSRAAHERAYWADDPDVSPSPKPLPNRTGWA